MIFDEHGVVQKYGYIDARVVEDENLLVKGFAEYIKENRNIPLRIRSILIEVLMAGFIKFSTNTIPAHTLHIVKDIFGVIPLPCYYDITDKQFVINLLSPIVWLGKFKVLSYPRVLKFLLYTLPVGFYDRFSSRYLQEYSIHGISYSFMLEFYKGIYSVVGEIFERESMITIRLYADVFSMKHLTILYNEILAKLNSGGAPLSKLINTLYYELFGDGYRETCYRQRLVYKEDIRTRHKYFVIDYILDKLPVYLYKKLLKKKVLKSIYKQSKIKEDPLWPFRYDLVLPYSYFSRKLVQAYVEGGKIENRFHAVFQDLLELYARLIP